MIKLIKKEIIIEIFIN